jgi:hypothetical protein
MPRHESTRMSMLLLLLVILLLLCSAAFDVPGAPAAAAEPAGITPKGRRTWMCVVFCRGMDAASENPAGSANPKGA